MSCLRIYQDNYIDATIVSNRFIDEYMAEANDAQLKIYLYLLRMMNAGCTFSISGIADVFNHTEKDVMRALKYWEKCRVLSLEYDTNKNLIGIHLLELADKEAPGAPKTPVVSLLPRQEEKNAEEEVPAQKPAAKAEAPNVPPSLSKEENKVPQAAPPAFAKPSYSLDELKAFQEKDSTAQLLFIAEQYLGRTLSPSDMKSILFFSDHLHFSDDLIDYLLQYCVERGKKDFRYIEKVAISWAEANISTPVEAEGHASRYDKCVYTIMNALGKTNSPTRKEAEFIRRWREDYAFETEIIIESCERTVLATDRHRFEYADKILASWKEAGVHHKADIAKLDEGFQKAKPAAKPASDRSIDKYNRFMQNNYDYDALEQELLRN